jgi:hypothetical protein
VATHHRMLLFFFLDEVDSVVPLLAGFYRGAFVFRKNTKSAKEFMKNFLSKFLHMPMTCLVTVILN